MEKNSASGFFGVHGCSLSSGENLGISVDEREPDQDKTYDVWSVPLFETVRASKHIISGTKHFRVEKLQWLGGQDEKKIWHDEERTHDPDQTDQAVGSPDGTDLPVTEGNADRDVALDCHAGQI